MKLAAEPGVICLWEKTLGPAAERLLCFRPGRRHAVLAP